LSREVAQLGVVLLLLFLIRNIVQPVYVAFDHLLHPLQLVGPDEEVAVLEVVYDELSARVLGGVERLEDLLERDVAAGEAGR
jgi:hypothetical protein